MEDSKLALNVVHVLLAHGRLAYAVLHDDLTFAKFSPNFETFLHHADIEIGQPVTEVFDALIGAEQVLQDILIGKLAEYRLEYINFSYQDFNAYITLNLWAYKPEFGNMGFMLVVEDVTSVALIEQRSVQTRNELQLLRIQLDRANAELQHQALFDALTGLPNRRYLDDELARYIEFSHRHSTALTAIMIDADNFKALNDTYGHLEGDQCLRLLASTIRESMRATDFAARYGGEEFCIFLPIAEIHQAQALARRIQGSLAEKSQHTFIRFTISIGIASLSSAQAIFSADDLLKAADAALYKAKREGKNRICVAGIE